MAKKSNIKIVSIVGARPQFIKTALLSWEIRKYFQEIVVHTGQHYDLNMSDIFYKDLNLPKVDYNLGVGSGAHGEQTGQMLEKIEKVLLKEKPNMVLIYGDTNSTIAGSLAAAKLHIPVAHVEAGLRSYNRQMPEEINRVVSDHICDLNFCPTKNAAVILKKEGIKKNVFLVGDVMADLQLKLQKTNLKSKTLNELKIKPKTYLLATLHRAENTDDVVRLKNIFQAFHDISETIIFPIHPRTKKYLKIYKMEKWVSAMTNLKMIDPVSYTENIALLNSAKMVLTDSGGVQKEAYLAKVPCVTLRDETEWVETIKAGWNKLTGAEPKKILKFVKNFPEPKAHPSFLGDGYAYQKITQILRDYLK